MSYDQSHGATLAITEHLSPFRALLKHGIKRDSVNLRQINPVKKSNLFARYLARNVCISSFEAISQF